MKKIVLNLIFIVFFFLAVFFISLATVGIETNKFNKLISDKISKTRNINLELFTIKFKLDPKELSLFLETKDPKIIYKGLSIPVQSIKAYVDFLSLFKSDLVTKKINISLEEINVSQLNKLSKIIKPSTFKSFLNNKIQKGKVISEIEVFLDNKGELKNYIAKGEVKNLKAELKNNLNLSKTSFNFFADKDDILIKNIFGEIENVKISDGDMKLNFENEIIINSNFTSKIFFDEKTVNKFSKYFFKVIY